jgi:hypothetical protein
VKALLRFIGYIQVMGSATSNEDLPSRIWNWNQSKWEYLPTKIVSGNLKVDILYNIVNLPKMMGILPTCRDLKFDRPQWWFSNLVGCRAWNRKWL